MGTLASFKTAVSIQAANTLAMCQSAHAEYNTLKGEVASNVDTRKQTFIATLVITCYVDNMTDNSAAKTCADKKRAASTSQWDITPPAMKPCSSKSTNENKYGPLDWTPALNNCRGAKGKESESTGNASELLTKDITLIKGHKLSSSFTTATEYELTVDTYPTAKKAGWHNILAFRKNGQSDGHSHSRIPAFWFFSNTFRLHMRQGVSGNSNDGCDPSKEFPST